MRYFGVPKWEFAIDPFDLDPYIYIYIYFYTYLSIQAINLFSHFHPMKEDKRLNVFRASNSK